MQIIVQCSQVAFVYFYIYFSITVSVAPSVSLSGPLGRGQFPCGLGGRASSCNVKVVSSTLTWTTLFWGGGGVAVCTPRAVSAGAVSGGAVSISHVRTC